MQLVPRGTAPLVRRGRSSRLVLLLLLAATVPLVLAGATAEGGSKPPSCTGDCNGDDLVTIDELVAGVDLALGRNRGGCAAFDGNQDGSVRIDELVGAVAGALFDCGRIATPTIPTRTATRVTPTRTRSPSATVSPSATRTPTPPAVTPPSATATTTPPLGFTLLTGRCEKPGPVAPSGRAPCPMDTLVRLFRCNRNSSDCLLDDAGRQLLDTIPSEIRTDASGQFELYANGVAVTGRRLLFVTDLAIIGEVTPQYLTGDFGNLSSTLQAKLSTGAPAAPFEIVIGPDSSGVVAAVARDGLENFTGLNLQDLLERTRSDPTLDYRGDSVAAAAQEAQRVAEQFFVPRLRIEASGNKSVAYFSIENESIFTYAITTVAIDGGGANQGVDSCGNLVPAGGVAVGDDVLAPEDVLSTPTLSGELSFSPPGIGRVCAGCSPAACAANTCDSSFSIDSMVSLVDDVRPPGVPLAAKQSLALEFCRAGDTYSFGSGQEPPTTLIDRSNPGPADGFRLGMGQSLVFASQTTPNCMAFAIGGFRLDEEGRVIKGLDMKQGQEVDCGQNLPLGVPATIPIGGFAKALSIARLSGDEQPDLIVADDVNDEVAVLLQNPAGGYDSVSRYSVGFSPVGVAVGDLNGDGRPDIVTANEDAGTVSVLRGSSDGTFANAQSSAVGAFPVAIGLGDIDGSGGCEMQGSSRCDVVTAHVPNGLSVLLNGAGGFGELRTYDGSPSSYPSALAVADLDGDGRADVVTTEEGSGTISVWQSQPTGLVRLQSYPAGSFPGAIVVAKLNGDDFLDVAVTSQTTSVVTVLFNQGGEGLAFGPPDAYGVDPNTQCVGEQPCPAGLFPAALAAIDMDGINGLDLIVANEGLGDVTVLLNRADSRLGQLFGRPQSFAVADAAFPVAVRTADLRAPGGGLNDIVVVSEVTGNAVSLEQ